MFEASALTWGTVASHDCPIKRDLRFGVNRSSVVSGASRRRSRVNPEVSQGVAKPEAQVRDDRAAYTENPERPDPFWDAAEAWTSGGC